MSTPENQTRMRQLIEATPCCRSSLRELCSAPGPANEPANEPVNEPANERAVAMLERCPALAILLVQSCLGRPPSVRRDYLRKMAMRPWREILVQLGLPVRPRTLRILSKLPREHCQTQTIEKLRKILCTAGHRWVHVLPHLHLIARDTVDLLGLDASIVSPALLRASTESGPDESTVFWLVGSIRSLRAELGDEGPWPYTGVPMEKLKLVEGELSVRLMPDCTAAFPTPPLSGRPGEIEPICDFAGLATEAAVQRNCVLTFVDEILRDRAFLYTVLGPERATLLLRKSAPSGEWSIHDLRAAQNADPDRETMARVSAWFLAEQANAFSGNKKMSQSNHPIP